jgi:hypothetical protein
MRRRTRVGIGVAVAVAVTAAAAVFVARGQDEPRAVLVDERRGVLHGVAFGDPLDSVRARRGEPSDDSQGFFPRGADYNGPPAIPNPPSDPRAAPTPLHYGETAYLISPTVGVFSMATLEDGARTKAGVGIGDALDRVRESYRRVRCGESVAGEAVLGGDTPMYPWCRATVGEVRIFFGEDPIESITLTKR